MPVVQSKAAFKNRGSFLSILDAGHFLHDFLKRALTEDLTCKQKKWHNSQVGKQNLAKASDDP